MHGDVQNLEIILNVWSVCSLSASPFHSPVQRKAGARYNDIIFLMNNVMGDRVNKQITLNETYDNIQETKRKIIDLNKDKHDLKEEMIERRNEYRVKKGDLTEKVIFFFI